MYKYILIMISCCMLGCSQFNANLGNHTYVVSSSAARANIVLALAFLQEGDIAKAHEKILLANLLNPNDALVCTTTGYFYETIAEYDKAAHAYRAAICLEPGNGITRNNYGAFLSRCGKYTEALPEFLSAIKDPGYIEVYQAYENAGLCYLKLHEAHKACFFFQKALMHNPKAFIANRYLKNCSHFENRQVHCQNKCPYKNT